MLSGSLLSSTLAIAEPRRVAIAGANPSSGALASALAESLAGDAWSAQTLVDALQPAPGERPLDLAMARPKERAAVRERVRSAGASVQADAVVLVRMGRAGRARRVTLLIVDPGAVSDPREVQVVLPLAASASDGDKLAAALLPSLAAIPPKANANANAVAVASSSPGGPQPLATGPAIAAPTRPPAGGASAEPPKAPPTPPNAAPVDADAGRTSPSTPERAPILRLALVGGVASRTFSYRDAMSPGLRTYSLAGVPTIGGRLDVFPLAHSQAGALRGLGMYGDFAAALGLSSESTTKSGSSRWTRWDAGARFQLPIGQARAGAAMGYGRESFGFDLTDVGTLPSTDYAFLRPAVEGGFDVGRFGVDASAAYLVVLAGGELADRARGTSVGGVEGRAQIRYALARHLDVSVAAAYTRFFYAFKPEPGDDFVSGGALDQMMRGELALAGRY